jgi:hypothetical protein
MSGTVDRRLGFIAAVVVNGIGLAVAAVFLTSPAGVNVGAGSNEGAGVPSPSPRDGQVWAPANEPHSETGAHTRVYVNEGAGFEVDLPADWDFVHDMAGGYQFSQADGGGIMGVRVELAGHPGTMCVGNSAHCALAANGHANCGRVLNNPYECHLRAVETLQDLLAVVHARDPRAPEAEPQPVALDGEDAWLVTSTFPYFEGREQDDYTYVLALHERRPFILMFMESTEHPARNGWIADLLGRFRFRDEESALPGSGTFASSEAGFAIDVPTSWVEEPDEDPDAVWIHGPEGGLRIRVGDGAGNILNCDVPTNLLCRMVRVESVETLVDLLTPPGNPRRIYGPGWAAVTRNAVSLGSLSAVQLKVRSWDGGPFARPRTRYYVVAVDNGRPIIIKWEPGTFHGREFQQLLASFRFQD